MPNVGNSKSKTVCFWNNFFEGTTLRHDERLKTMKRMQPLLFASVLICFFGLGLSRHTVSHDQGTFSHQPGAVIAQAEPVVEVPPPPPRRFTMIAVGDIMLDRSVGRAIRNNGYQSILEKVRDLTRSADIAFANLECPLATTGPHDPPNCIFRADPSTVKVLTDGGFNIVSLANNHTLDAGRQAVLQTLDTLESHDILYCGAHRERERSGEVVVVEAGDPPMRLGFIACTDLSFVHGSYNKVDPDRANLVQQIQEARLQCDKLFVSIHWGDEYQSYPNNRQKETAHIAIDAGADVILGHHPHTLQGIEVYNGGLILYSMGNFVFDQREGERMESAIFHFTYTEGWGWQLYAKPVWISRARMGPIYPEEARRDKILARLAKISEPFGTELEIKDGKAWLRIREGDTEETIISAER